MVINTDERKTCSGFQHKLAPRLDSVWPKKGLLAMLSWHYSHISPVQILIDHYMTMELIREMHTHTCTLKDTLILS